MFRNLDQSVHAPCIVLQGKFCLYVKICGFKNQIVLGWSLLESFLVLLKLMESMSCFVFVSCQMFVLCRKSRGSVKNPKPAGVKQMHVPFFSFPTSQYWNISLAKCYPKVASNSFIFLPAAIANPASNALTSASVKGLVVSLMQNDSSCSENVLIRFPGSFV